MRQMRVGRKPAILAMCFLAIASIVALAFAPAASAQVRPILQYFGIVSCNSSSPCAQDNNKGSGPGLQAQSLLGTGAVSITKFNSTSFANGTSGLSGEDLSASGTFDSGVSGLSVRGTGVSGSSTSGNGITASSVSGTGLIATSTNSDAIYATSTNFYGIGGLTLNPSNTTGTGYAGVLAQDNSSDGGHLNSGVLGYSINGFGVAAFSSKWVGANVIGGYVNAFVPALSIVGNTVNAAPADLIDACSPSTALSGPCQGTSGSKVFSVDGGGRLLADSGVIAACQINCGNVLIVANNTGGSHQNTLFSGVNYGSNDVFDVDDSGNVYAHSFNATLSATRIQPTATGQKVETYSQQSAQPSLEDFGEAQLVNGQADVALDPAFAATIDPHANYLVFITPRGDNRGLYVAGTSPRDFNVRESQGGRSTLVFDYRIVARPFGDASPRLPIARVPAGSIQRARRRLSH